MIDRITSRTPQEQLAFTEGAICALEYVIEGSVSAQELLAQKLIDFDRLADACAIPATPAEIAAFMAGESQDCASNAPTETP